MAKEPKHGYFCRTFRVRRGGFSPLGTGLKLHRDSDNRDISRARQAFFSGDKAMLLVTERFHFFRRYVQQA